MATDKRIKQHRKRSRIEDTEQHAALNEPRSLTAVEAAKLIRVLNKDKEVADTLCVKCGNAMKHDTAKEDDKQYCGHCKNMYINHKMFYTTEQKEAMAKAREARLIVGNAEVEKTTSDNTNQMIADFLAKRTYNEIS